jgi:hypothetical protein
VSLLPASLVAVAKRLCVLCSRSSGRRRALFGDVTAADVDAGATGAVLAIGSARKREMFAEQECLSLRGLLRRRGLLRSSRWRNTRKCDRARRRNCCLAYITIEFGRL